MYFLQSQNAKIDYENMYYHTEEKAVDQLPVDVRTLQAAASVRYKT